MVRDWQSPGDGLLTFDTETGLEWLDWTVTTGISYDDMPADLLTSPEYLGFRYASLTDIETFFDNANLPNKGSPADPTVDPISWSGSGSQLQPFFDLMGLLGETASSNPYTRTWAWFPDFGRVNQLYISSNGTDAVASYTTTGPPKGYADTFHGHVLVREDNAAVPEPTTLAIWSILGGIGLVIGHRRRIRKAAIAAKGTCNRTTV